MIKTAESKRVCFRKPPPARVAVLLQCFNASPASRKIVVFDVAHTLFDATTSRCRMVGIPPQSILLTGRRGTPQAAVWKNERCHWRCRAGKIGPTKVARQSRSPKSYCPQRSRLELAHWSGPPP